MKTLTNTVAQGAKYVKEYQELLNRDGWITWIPGKKAVWYWSHGQQRAMSASQDILECFDIIAMKADSPILLIQVTTAAPPNDQRVYERRKKIERKIPWTTHSIMKVVARIKGRRFTFDEHLRIGKEEWKKTAHL